MDVKALGKSHVGVGQPNVLRGMFATRSTTVGAPVGGVLSQIYVTKARCVLHLSKPKTPTNSNLCVLQL